MFHYITINASLIISSMWCFVTSRSMLFSSFIKKPLPLPRVLNPLFHICKKELILTLTRIHLYHLSSGDLYTAAASFKQFQSQTDVFHSSFGRDVSHAYLASSELKVEVVKNSKVELVKYLHNIIQFKMLLCLSLLQFWRGPLTAELTTTAALSGAGAAAATC